MNKILILLSLIYLISCKLACRSTETPKNKEDCYNRGLDNKDNDICCYIRESLSSLVNISSCLELDKRMNIEFAKEMRIYSHPNITIEEFSCPTKEKSDDSSCKDCNCIMDKENYKNCLNETVVDEANNFCCFALISINGAKQGLCKELQKNISVYDLKQKLTDEYSMLGIKIEDLKCPPNEEKKENSPQGNTSNKGFYIKSGFALIFAFLF